MAKVADGCEQNNAIRPRQSVHAMVDGSVLASLNNK